MQVNPLRSAMLLVALLAAVMLPACKTSPASPSDQPNPGQPPSAYTVTIALIGLDPSSLQVPVGARVTFMNKDINFPHHMTSNCPEVDAVGLLQPTQSGTTAAFMNAKTCDYWDRLYAENPLRQGKIIIR